MVLFTNTHARHAARGAGKFLEGLGSWINNWMVVNRGVPPPDPIDPFQRPAGWADLADEQSLPTVTSELASDIELVSSAITVTFLQ